MENETGFRNRMNESYRNYVEEEKKSAEEATKKENEEGVQAVQMEFKVLEMNRKKQEEETKKLKKELTKKNKEKLSAAIKSGEKTKEEQKEECLRWEDKLKAKQEELVKICNNGEQNEEKIRDEKKELEKMYGERKEARQEKFFKDTTELKDQNGRILEDYEKKRSELAVEQRANRLDTTNQLNALTESKITGQVALLEAGRRDQENSAYCDTADKLCHLFQTVKNDIRSQEIQLARTLDAMKTRQNLFDKPDMEQVTSALHELESGIQSFRASNSDFRELQIEVFEKVSELTGLIATINTGMHNYQKRVVKTAVDFTEHYKNAKKVLLELSKLFLSFNINEESHASKVISEHLKIAQSGNAVALKGRGSDSQITDGQ